MISNILTTVVGELNENFKSKFRTSEDCVLISNFVNQDGSPVAENKDRIVCTLINIEEEPTLKSRSGRSSNPGVSTHGFTNITIMFASFFYNENYVEGLKFISETISFFNSKPIFDQQNTPELESNIEKVLLEQTTLSIESLSHIYSMLGANHVPSVIYRIRILGVNE